MVVQNNYAVVITKIKINKIHLHVNYIIRYKVTSLYLYQII